MQSQCFDSIVKGQSTLDRIFLGPFRSFSHLGTLIDGACTHTCLSLSLSLSFCVCMRTSLFSIDDEIKMTNKMTVEIRRARLEKKLKDELLQYEAELNARGLAISKSRD